MSDEQIIDECDPYSPYDTVLLRALRAEARAENAEQEATALREMVEGKFDAYTEDGEPVLPRGWVPVDGGRLDELENAEQERADSQAQVLHAAVIIRCLLTLIDTDPTWRASGFAKDARDWLAGLSDKGTEHDDG